MSITLSQSQKEQIKSFIRCYYDYIDNAAIDDICNLLHEQVEVTFLDASRNWSSVEVARSKFGLMYERNPTFASFIKDISEPVYLEESKLIKVEMMAWFGTRKEKEDMLYNNSTGRKMLYLLELNSDDDISCAECNKSQLKIKRIEHL